VKKLILSLCLFTVFINGCSKPIHHTNIDPLVSFNKKEQEKISIKVGLYLIKEDLEKMPFAEKDADLWHWYFMEGLKTVFENVVIIDDIEKIKKPLEFGVIVKPELSNFGWFGSYYFGQYKNCILGLKFRFLNKYGVEQFSFIIEEKSTTAPGFSAPSIGRGDQENPFLAQAMDEVMKKFQTTVKQRKEEIIAIGN